MSADKADITMTDSNPNSNTQMNSEQDNQPSALNERDTTNKMEIDHVPNSQNQLCWERPNYGTTRYSHTHKPTIESSTTLEQLFEEYKQFALLKKKDDMANAIEAGTESFLVSTKWLKRYSEFILHDQFKNNTSENDLKMSDNHFTEMHPGPITNEKDLTEEDTEHNNLYGTGKMKGQESEYIDNYVE